jgi:hypothetical protein
MSRVTNIVLLFDTWLDKDDVNHILETLKPLEDQELNKGKNPFTHIDNYSVGISRYLERTIIIGALYQMNDNLFSDIIKSLKLKYNIQVVVNDEHDDWWDWFN